MISLFYSKEKLLENSNKLNILYRKVSFYWFIFIWNLLIFHPSNIWCTLDNKRKDSILFQPTNTGKLIFIYCWNQTNYKNEIKYLQNSATCLMTSIYVIFINFFYDSLCLLSLQGIIVAIDIIESCFIQSDIYFQSSANYFHNNRSCKYS